MLRAYAALLRVLPEPVLLVSGEGVVLVANARAAQFLGRAGEGGEGVEGATLEALTDEPPERLHDYLSACIRSPQLIPAALTWRLPGGQLRPSRVDCGVVRPWTPGEPALVLLRLRAKEEADQQFLLLNEKIEELNREVQARRRAQAELEQLTAHLEAEVQRRTAALDAANAELRSKNQELQDFAYVASHDLQEPLRKIRVFSELLRDHAPRDDEEAGYLARIHAAATRMSALIASLLAFSRAGADVAKRHPVDLSAVAADVVADLEGRLAETGGHVDVGALPTVEADATQMRQLFQNLIGNALKFHRPDTPPRVVVRARQEAGTHVLTVADNGVGFDPKYAARLFQPFQRLHGRDRYDGTGMGLAICRRIAERHGGTIAAESTPGQGTTFIVRLPAEAS